MQQHPTVENLILLHVFIAIIFNHTEIVCKIDYNPDLGTSSPKEIEKINTARMPAEDINHYHVLPFFL